MMEILSAEGTLLAFSAVGGTLAGAAATWMWQASRRLEVRTQFLNELQSDLDLAFDEADAILADPSAPTEIRHALVRLLCTHADAELGRKLSNAFLQAFSSPPEDSDSPLADAMNKLHVENRALALRAHHALLSLSMGLVVIHNANAMTVSKVQERTAKNPDTLWSQIGETTSILRPHALA